MARDKAVVHSVTTFLFLSSFSLPPSLNRNSPITTKNKFQRWTAKQIVQSGKKNENEGKRICGEILVEKPNRVLQKNRTDGNFLEIV